MTVGEWVFIGTAKPPYTLTNIAGVGNDANLESSPDAFIGAVLQAVPTAVTEFGERKSTAGTTTAFSAGGVLSGAADTTKSIGVIRHQVTAIRCTAAGGTPIIYLEYGM